MENYYEKTIDGLQDFLHHIVLLIPFSIIFLECSLSCQRDAIGIQKADKGVLPRNLDKDSKKMHT